MSDSTIPIAGLAVIGLAGALVLGARVALVTGASRGIGKGIAIALGAPGASVYVSARSTRPPSGARC